jgi:hypothetical protein
VSLRVDLEAFKAARVKLTSNENGTQSSSLYTQEIVLAEAVAAANVCTASQSRKNAITKFAATQGLLPVYKGAQSPSTSI